MQESDRDSLRANFQYAVSRGRVPKDKNFWDWVDESNLILSRKIYFGALHPRFNHPHFNWENTKDWSALFRLWQESTEDDDYPGMAPGCRMTRSRIFDRADDVPDEDEK